MRRALVAMIVAVLTCANLTSSNAAIKEVKGSTGQILTASATSVKSGAVITVKGKYFDESVGIYLGFCVPQKLVSHQRLVLVELTRMEPEIPRSGFPPTLHLTEWV